MAKKASDIALTVYKTFNLSGSARIDMLIKDRDAACYRYQYISRHDGNIPCAEGMGLHGKNI